MGYWSDALFPGQIDGSIAQNFAQLGLQSSAIS